MFHYWVMDDKEINALGLESWSCTNPDCGRKNLLCSKDPRLVTLPLKDECPFIPHILKDNLKEKTIQYLSLILSIGLIAAPAFAYDFPEKTYALDCVRKEEDARQARNWDSMVSTINKDLVTQGFFYSEDYFVLSEKDLDYFQIYVKPGLIAKGWHVVIYYPDVQYGHNYKIHIE